MKEKKKETIVLIVILVLIILGLAGFIVYDKVLNKKAETKNVEATTKMMITDKKILSSNDLRCEEGINKCDIAKKGKFKISLKEADNGLMDLYVNDKLCGPFREELFQVDEVVFLDDNYLYVQYGDIAEGLISRNIIFDSNANIVEDLNKKSGSGNWIYYDANNDSFKSIITRGNGIDSTAMACIYEPSEIYYKEIEIKYLGDGVVSEPKLLKSQTSEEIIRETYGMSCDEIKNSTSDDLAFERMIIETYSEQ